MADPLQSALAAFLDDVAAGEVLIRWGWEENGALVEGVTELTLAMGPSALTAEAFNAGVLPEGLTWAAGLREVRRALAARGGAA
jgi:hypothetical protein